MSLDDFRKLREELKFIPDECDNILKHFPGPRQISELLVTALNALSLADEIITKQADTILRSTNEIIECAKESRTKSPVGQPAPSIMSASDDNVFEISGDKSECCATLSLPDASKRKNEIQPTTPITDEHCLKGYATALKKKQIISNNDIVKTTDVSEDSFQPAKTRRKFSRKRSHEIIGRKPMVHLGTCARASKFHVFVSRLGPNVTAQAVKDFCQSMLDEDCEVLKLMTKFETYTSFRITCSRVKKQTILNPDNWESGIYVRPFYV